GHRGQQGAIDGSFDRAALAADQGAVGLRHSIHLLLLLRQADLQRAGLAVRLGRRARKLEIHLYRAVGIFPDPVEAGDVRRCLHLVPDRGRADLHVRGARPLQARARRVPALPGRHAGLLRARLAAGLLRRAADAGAVLAWHATDRQRRDCADPVVAEGRRISVADDVADLRLRYRVSAAGDPDVAGADRHRHLEDAA